VLDDSSLRPNSARRNALFAAAVYAHSARTRAVSLLSLSHRPTPQGADCLSKWVGEAERQLRLLFEQAKIHAPSVIFFDEIDGDPMFLTCKKQQCAQTSTNAMASMSRRAAGVTRRREGTRRLRPPALLDTQRRAATRASARSVRHVLPALSAPPPHPTAPLRVAWRAWVRCAAGLAPVRSVRQDQIHASIVSTLLALMDGLDSRGHVSAPGAVCSLDSIAQAHTNLSSAFFDTIRVSAAAVH
jgi:ATPase family associated with various cellular activities (AAA)